MVVEDDPALLGALQKLFADFQVVCVQTLAEAHAVMQRSARRIDVIVIDYRLPDGTADQLLESISDTAVVLVSNDERAAACATRFNVPFVRKPFDGQALFAIVADAHARRVRPRR